VCETGFQGARPLDEAVCYPGDGECEYAQVDDVDDLSDRLETRECMWLIFGREEQCQSARGHGEGEPCPSQVFEALETLL